MILRSRSNKHAVSTNFDPRYTRLWSAGPQVKIATYFEFPLNHDRTFYNKQLLPAHYLYNQQCATLSLQPRPGLLSVMREFYDNGSTVLESFHEGMGYLDFLQQTINPYNLQYVQKKIEGESNVLLFPKRLSYR